eukprot:CAMPEP_0204902378 /NCGR_PEP_ID=MMETSP1397-20131031/3632_1 /ASSEMBLY_ACC=CAM_ASM_000891 /TAXON_ID=49980 /ORGANISM="Climacostomum Climacostomum virens, Strain Stock W-24" /LENGTH=625 /DNA_ID=CAMNT_0052070873 /DNA_START=37 /DNA_END=1911 /DNA_ORIENTATION=-
MKKKQKQRKKQHIHNVSNKRSKTETAMRAIGHFTQENDELQDVLSKANAFFKSLCEEMGLPSRDESEVSSFELAKRYLLGCKQQMLRDHVGEVQEDYEHDLQLEAIDSSKSALLEECKELEGSLDECKQQLTASFATLATDTSRPASELQELRVKIKSAEQLRNSVKLQKDNLHEKLMKNDLVVDLTSFSRSRAFKRIHKAAADIKSSLEAVKAYNLQLATERDRATIDSYRTEAQEKETNLTKDLRSLIDDRIERLKRARSEHRTLKEELEELKLKPLSNSITRYQRLIEKHLEDRTALQIEIRHLNDKMNKLYETQHENIGLIGELEAEIRQRTELAESLKETQGQFETLNDHLTCLRNMLLKLRKVIKTKSSKSQELEDEACKLNDRLVREAKANERLKLHCDRSAKVNEQMYWKNANLLTQINESCTKVASKKESQAQDSASHDIASQEQQLLLELLEAKEREEQRLVEINERLKFKSDSNKELIARLNSNIQGLFPPALPNPVNFSATRLSAILFNQEKSIISQAIALSETQSYTSSSNLALSLINAARSKFSPELDQESSMLRELALCEVCSIRTKELLLTECMHSFCRACIEKRTVESAVECPKCRVQSARHQVRVIW